MMKEKTDISKNNSWDQQIQKLTKINNKEWEYYPNKKIKVLVGDYMKFVAMQTNSVLKNMGIETEFVSSGEEIISKINNGEKFDLIISNGFYPHGMDGSMVIKQLKSNKNFKIPVIVLTVDEDGRREFIEDGFDEYIVKPLNTEKVIDVLPKVINGLEFIQLEVLK